MNKIGLNLRPSDLKSTLREVGVQNLNALKTFYKKKMVLEGKKRSYGYQTNETMLILDPHHRLNQFSGADHAYPQSLKRGAGGVRQAGVRDEGMDGGGLADQRRARLADLA